MRPCYDGRDGRHLATLEAVLVAVVMKQQGQSSVPAHLCKCLLYEFWLEIERGWGLDLLLILQHLYFFLWRVFYYLFFKY